ncbi:unnamed protein product [Prunus armeniaca]
MGSTELVGMKFIREQVDLLLAQPTDGVRFMGIWGMGGIGKTTIAQLVYDSISTHFEVSSFLANVREVSQRGNLVDLQRQLLSPILKDQITQGWDEQWGTSVIKNCLYNKKVLLILDDVSESSQLEKLTGEKDWFGKGSLIIITTRDRRLLDQHDIHIQYEVEALGDDDALVLFSRNAFIKNEPEEGFLELSKGFVNYARGLPLALKLLGCLVYKRDQDEWKSELDKLQKIPNSQIFDLLKISYDGLDEMKKEIFLDVAFFHKSKGKEKVIEILDGCGLHGCVGINDLVKKSLLTISNGNVEMHDLIQEMAWEIVHRECPEEPGRRSRLCNHDDISHVFIDNTDLPYLKKMDLFGSENLVTTPDFSGIPNLELLDFGSCKNLVEIHPSIANLKCLKILDLSFCSKLKKIPEFSGPMKNLSTLILQGTSIEKLPSSIGCLVGLSWLNIFQRMKSKEFVGIKWIFLLISLCLEILSIACDQASSPRNPHYALFGMMFAIAAVLICIWELIYKGKNERVELRRWRTLWWFYYPGPQRRLYGSLPDIYGLVGAISQCICSTVQYLCFIRHNQNPIKASFLPAIFLICLGASRLSYIRTDETNEKNE